MVTHPWGLRDREQRGGRDDPAKDSCPHVSPLWGFGDARGGIARSPPRRLRGREGVCSSVNRSAGGRNSTQDLPLGPPRSWLRLRCCFQLLDPISTRVPSRPPTRGLHKGTGRGQRQPLWDGHGPRAGGKLTPVAWCSPRGPHFPSPRCGASTPQSLPPVRDPIRCPQETLPCASPRVPIPSSVGTVRSPYRLCSSSCLKKTPSGTGSPPWGEEEGTAVSGEGDPNSGVSGNAKPSVPPRWQTACRDTHWDTSAMCLWRKVTHRSSSSSRRTSLIRASPMPLVSYLGRGQGASRWGRGWGAHGPLAAWARGRWRDMGALLSSASNGVKLFQLGFTPRLLVALQLLNAGKGQRLKVRKAPFASILPTRLQAGMVSPNRWLVMDGGMLRLRLHG